MSDELKACPFCKAIPTHTSSEGWNVSHKDGCFLYQPLEIGDPHRLYLKDIKAWNTRASGWVSVEDRLPENISKKYWVTDGIDQWSALFRYYTPRMSPITHWRERPLFPEDLAEEE